jgi:hypothetical protein
MNSSVLEKKKFCRSAHRSWLEYCRHCRTKTKVNLTERVYITIIGHSDWSLHILDIEEIARRANKSFRDLVQSTSTDIDVKVRNKSRDWNISKYGNINSSAGIPWHDQILDEIYSALCADENWRAKVLKIASNSVSLILSILFTILFR